MSRQYATIPMHISFEMNNIRAMTEHNKSLYIATDGRKIHSFPLSIDKNCNISMGQHNSLIVKVNDYEISEIRSFPPDHLLVHIKSNSGVPGPLLALPSNGPPIRVVDSTDCFAVNSSSQRKINSIAIISEKRLIIKEYDGQKFIQIFSREFPEPPLAVGLSYPNVALICPTKSIVLNILNDGMTEIKNFGVDHPYILWRDSHTFISYSGISGTVVDLNLNADLAPATFENICTDHTRCGSIIASMSENSVNLYDFKHHKGVIKMNNCKALTTFDSSILLATDKDIFILKDMTEAFEHVSAGSIDVALNSIPSKSLDVISSLFEMIWNNGKQKEALLLLKLKEFEDGFIDVLSIFDFLVFSPPLPKTGRLLSTKHTKDKGISLKLAEILNDIRSRISDETKILIDTAIIEIYSFFECNKEVCDYFDIHPIYSDESLKEFFKNGTGVPYAMYMSNLGKPNEALQALKENSSIEFAARIISKFAGDWNFVQEQMPWLFEKSPEQACVVLSNDLIDISKSRSYILNNYPQYYLRFLMSALTHKDIISRKSFVNDLVTGLIKLLVTVRQPNFKREDAAFLSCMIKDKNCSLDQIEKDASDELINILRSFRDDIDIQALMPNVSQINIYRVQVEIYTAAGCLNEALQIVWSSGLDECIKFCRDYENPQQAFSCLFKLIHEKSDHQIHDLERIITDNIEIIDVAEALNTIDDEEDLENVVGFISETYRKITTERRSKEISAAFAESRAKEAEYDRVVLESGHVSLDGEEVCAGCNKLLGSQYFVRTPNGLLYHPKCLAIQK